MLAATLITYTGRRGSWSARPLLIRSGLRPNRLLAVGRLRGVPVRLHLIEAPRRCRRALDGGTDPDLAGFDRLGLRDPQLQHSMLEGGSRLVCLDARWQGQRPVDRSAPNLREKILALTFASLLAIRAT